MIYRASGVVKVRNMLLVAGTDSGAGKLGVWVATRAFGV